MATIHLFGECGFDYRPQDVVSAIKAIDPTTGNSVDVYINSIGGDAYDGIAIYNLLEQAKLNGTVVNVTIVGLAASAASIVAMAASPGCLKMYANASLMVHRAAMGCYGTKEDHQSAAAALEALDASLAQIYGKRMTAVKGGDVADNTLASADLMLATSYLDAKQAIECGLCDGVTEGELKIAALDVSRAKLLGKAYAPVAEKITAAQQAAQAQAAAIPADVAAAKGKENVTKDEILTAFAALTADEQKQVRDTVAADALAAAQTVVADYEAITNLIGAKGDEAIGRLHAWKSSDEAAQAALDEAAKAAEAQAEVAKVDELLSDKTRVTPFVAKQIRAKLTDKSLTFKAAQAWVASLPVIPASQRITAAVDGGAGGTAIKPVLTHEGKAFAQMTGLEQHNLKRSNPDLYNEMRAAHMAGQK